MHIFPKMLQQVPRSLIRRHIRQAMTSWWFVPSAGSAELSGEMIADQNDQKMINSNLLEKRIYQKELINLNNLTRNRVQEEYHEKL